MATLTSPTTPLNGAKKSTFAARATKTRISLRQKQQSTDRDARLRAKRATAADRNATAELERSMDAVVAACASPPTDATGSLLQLACDGLANADDVDVRDLAHRFATHPLRPCDGLAQTCASSDAAAAVVAVHCLANVSAALRGTLEQRAHLAQFVATAIGVVLARPDVDVTALGPGALADVARSGWHFAEHPQAAVFLERLFAGAVPRVAAAHFCYLLAHEGDDGSGLGIPWLALALRDDASCEAPDASSDVAFFATAGLLGYARLPLHRDTVAAALGTGVADLVQCVEHRDAEVARAALGLLTVLDAEATLQAASGRLLDALSYAVARTATCEEALLCMQQLPHHVAKTPALLGTAMSLLAPSSTSDVRCAVLTLLLRLRNEGYTDLVIELCDAAHLEEFIGAADFTQSDAELEHIQELLELFDCDPFA